MQTPPPQDLHHLAFCGDLLAFQSIPPSELFHSVSNRGQTVLYAACRSPKTSAELVQHLIEKKGCIANQPNGLTGNAAGSFPQHALVQTLHETVNSDPVDLLLAGNVLNILVYLRSKGADMNAKNVSYQKTALEEFQAFEARMRSSAVVGHLVPKFLEVLTVFAPQTSVNANTGLPLHQIASMLPSTSSPQTLPSTPPPIIVNPVYQQAFVSPSVSPPPPTPTWSSWSSWASSNALPQEDIFICSHDHEGVEQRWPPGFMSPVASRNLHRVGVTKCSTLIQAARELDSETFRGRFGQVFFERTRDVQDALKAFFIGAQGQINEQDYHSRLQIEAQHQGSMLGFQPVAFVVDPLQLEPLHTAALKVWDAKEKELFDACYGGNLATVEKILSENEIDLNAKDCGPNTRNQTYLYAACRGQRCHPAVVDLLLRNLASTKVPCGDAHSLPVHALVANFVDSANQADQSKFIPLQRFDEYFGRISEIVKILKHYHADFNSANLYGHSPLSELQHEVSYAPARQHPKYSDFCQLISDSSAKKLAVEAVIPVRPAEDADLAAAYDFLRQNPRLPDHTSQTISEQIWSEKSNDWTPILGHTPQLEHQKGCGLVKFMDKAMYFNAATLELKLRYHHKVPISLVLCNWPQDCSANCEEPRVQWQWLRPKPADPKPEDEAHKFITRGTVAPVHGASGTSSNGWVPIEDESILQQLRKKSASIQYGQHKYKLSSSWSVEPEDSDTHEGPLTGFRIRWVPDFSVSNEEDAELDTGGYDDSVQLQMDQMEHQRSVLPLSAIQSVVETMVFPEQTYAAPITLDRVIHRRYDPSAAAHLEPNRQLSAPCLLPAGWSQEIDHSSGRPYYVNRNVQPPESFWDAPPPATDTRLEQWFAKGGFEPIPDQFFNRSVPDSSSRILLRACTSYEVGGTLQMTGLPVTFFSSNPSVARIEDGQYLRVVGPGNSTIYAYQAGNHAFQPTNDWGVHNSTQPLNVLELIEFDVAAPETRLKTAYQIVYTSLHDLLNLGPQNLTWSKDLKKVTIVATVDKAESLSAIWAAIIGAHHTIEHFQRAGVASLRKAQKSLIDVISKDSPWIPQDSPVPGGKREPNAILKDIEEYFEMLKTECRTEIEGFEKEVDAVIDANVVDWMQWILSDCRKPDFLNRLNEQVLAQLRKSTRRTDMLKPDISVSVLNKFFDLKVLQTESRLKEKGKVEQAKFAGCRAEFEEFRRDIIQRVSGPSRSFLLSTLIQDFMIHLVSASRGLAFYKESAKELIRSVLKNDVTSVTTATGSGKSTLMPLLLIAANIGIKRVAVTQPRRFAAVSIRDTIANYHGPSVVGYAMAGESVNPMAPIVYITDGLLRTQMYLDKDYSGFDCIIIDEVHERSENIDACVAMLAKMKELRGKMPRVILSSATLDDKVIKPFKDAHCTIGKCSTKVDSPFARLLHYPDRHCANPSCSICQQFSVSKYHLSMIKFVNKHSDKYLSRGPTGNGQMLVFMPSTQDVLATVAELKESNINAHPLYAGQDGKVQSESLVNGTIFVSTNIAETSLTFPNLRVVIDLGKVQRPRLIDRAGKLLPAPLMETIDASKATLSQRMGRVGRTCDGHYIALFPWSSQSSRPEHIQAGLELFPTDSVRFSLSKQLRSPQPLDLAFPGKTIRIDALDPEFITFPELGNKMMADAFKASLTLGCSEDILLLSAFMMKIQPKSQNLVVNSGQKLLPAAASGSGLPCGDISVVLEIMRRINSIVPPGSPQQPVSKKVVSDAIASWCSKHGLDVHSRPLYKAYLEFQKMRAFYLPKRPPPGVDHFRSHPLFFRMNPPKKSFDALGKLWNGFAFGRKCADGSPDMRCPENYQVRSLVRGSSMSKVVEALSHGYPDNFFVHCAELDGPVNSYSRIADRGDGGDGPGEPMKTYYTLHTKSSLAKADKEKFTIVFAISSMMFGAEMHDVLEPFRLGALGLAEPCPINVLPDNHAHQIVRRISLHADDKVPSASGQEEIVRNSKRFLELKGSARAVVSRELQIRKDPALRVTGQKIKLVDETVKDKLQQPQHAEKLKQLKEMKDKNVFKPLGYMWKNLYNSKLEIHVGNPQDLRIEFTGRRQQLAVLQKHIQYWGHQLKGCPAIKVEADDIFSGIEHYRIPDPKNFGGRKNPEYEAFKKRLHNITAEDLCDEDLFEMTQGKDATRESRMEAVSRIALQNFECRVVGGFVRDWIVNGDRKHPKSHPRDWVEVQKTYEAKQPPDSHKGWMKWDFKPDVEVVPKDLDIELMTQYFDVNRFIYEVTQYGIVVDHHQHIPQRHIFLFDKETGPFTADFIEPHFACLHTLGDFNVNCMCVSRFPDQIGLKMEYRSSNGEHTLDVNKVIGDCRQRQLVPMQGDAGIIRDRTEKMRKRGWRILASIPYVPHTKQHFKDDPIFEHYALILANPIKGAGNPASSKAGRVFAMYRIHNPVVEGVYSNLKSLYPTPNERCPLVDTPKFAELGKKHPSFGKAVNGFDLFHGTKKDAVPSIMQNGFDDHFFNPGGFFGAGAYFADDPGLSMSFVDASPSHMFVCNVILGNTNDAHYQNPLHAPLGRDFRPPHGVDSMKGRVNFGSYLRQAEYIVYRFGQCKATYLLRFDH